MSALRIVLLDFPYEVLPSSTLAQDLFGRMVGLKLLGYQKEYPYGVMPVDLTDLIGTHHIVCIHEKGELQPVMAYKTVHLDRCEKFGIEFPPLVIAKQTGSIPHIRGIENIIKRCQKNATPLVYDCSWTMDLSIRKSEKRTRVIRDLMTAMFCAYHETYGNPEIIAFAALKFRMEDYLKSWGFSRVMHNQSVLSSFHQKSLIGAEAVMMYLKEFSKESKSTALRFKEQWDNRLVIAPEDSETKIKKAA